MAKKPRLSPSSPSSSAASGDSSDRLSDLPDVIRLHILTLLPFKSAVAMSALSSKWRNLWAHRFPFPSSLAFASDAAPREEFVGLVDGAIERRGVRRVDCLMLEFHQGEAGQSDLRRWLAYASSCSAESLSLHVHPPSISLRRPSARRKSSGNLTFHFPLASPILAALSLRGLHLSASSSATTKLEMVYLQSVSLTDAALKKVVGACPELRVLDVRNCKELRKVQICSVGGKLRSVTIVDCGKATELSVGCTPSLKSLRFSGNFLSRYTIEDASRLEDVYFSFSGPGSVIPPSNWITCLTRLTNVKSLTLCSHTLHYIAVTRGNGIGPIRRFNKLEELQLLMMMMCDTNLNDIFTFLRLCKCLHLNRLFIEFPTCSYDPYTVNYMKIEEENPPEESVEKLETIKIKNYKGHQNETRLLKYLLSKSPNLKSLIIVAPKENLDLDSEECSNNSSKILHFLHMQILLLPKASKDAQILFCENDEGLIQPTHSELFCRF